VHVQVTDGQTLAFADRSFDLVLAVDSFPYIVDAGLLESALDEAARVLVPNGALVILNLSHEEEAFTAHPAFKLEVEAARPFKVWNGRAYVLRRR